MKNKYNEEFNFTYSAKEQEEIKNIRKKYAVADECEDKMEQLRRLDKSVTEKATVKSLVIGIIGALILGVGMSLAMSDFGKILGDNPMLSMSLGIPIGVVGLVLVSLAYPVYNRVVKKERKKIAPEILRLTDELMK